MYTEYFGLTQEPFRSRFEGLGIYVGPQQATAISRLKKALATPDAVVTVCGPVGIGKSTIVSRALEVAAPEARIARIGRMRLGPDEVLELLLEQFGVSRQPTGTIQRFATFKRLLHAGGEKGKRAVIVVEDARRIGIDAVIELEALTAADGADASSANLILMGDTDLPAFLANPALARLQQRTRTRQTLVPFTRDELHDYLKHCTHLAGGEFDAIFEKGSVEVLHRCAAGIPRIVNNICETALNEAADEDATRVSVELLQHVARNVYGIEPDTAAVEAAVPAPAEDEDELAQDEEFHCTGEYDEPQPAARNSIDDFEELPVATFDAQPALSVVAPPVSKASMTEAADAAAPEAAVPDEPVAEDAPAEVLEQMLSDAIAGLDYGAGDSAAAGDRGDDAREQTPPAGRSDAVSDDEESGARADEPSAPATVEIVADAAAGDAGGGEVSPAASDTPPAAAPDVEPAADAAEPAAPAAERPDPAAVDAAPADDEPPVTDVAAARAQPVDEVADEADIDAHAETMADDGGASADVVELVAPAAATEAAAEDATGDDDIPVLELEDKVVAARGDDARVTEERAPVAADIPVLKPETPSNVVAIQEAALAADERGIDTMTPEAEELSSALEELELAISSANEEDDDAAPEAEASGSEALPDIILDKQLDAPGKPANDLSRWQEELAKARSLEEMSDLLAETVFGDASFDQIAADAVAKGAPDDVPAAKAPAEDEPAPVDLKLEDETAPEPDTADDDGARGMTGGFDMSISKRFELLKALGSSVSAVAQNDPDVMEITLGEDEPAAEPPSGPAPEPIESQIDTAITQSRLALTKADIERIEKKSPPKAEEKPKQSTGLFGGLFRRSSK